MNSVQTPYENLTPDAIMSALEGLGYRPTGALLALNSYENRVYQVGIEDSDPVVVKFYRPHRWSREAIAEEHSFAYELEANEIPVVTPVRDDNGASLQEYAGYYLAVFPRRGGRWPDLDSRENLAWLGRLLGRIHMVGKRCEFTSRLRLDPQQYGYQSYQYLLENGFLPPDLEQTYRSVAEELLRLIDPVFTGEVAYQRIYGDCHPGNILWHEINGPFFVDLDDCLTGPIVQDLWMLLSGSREEMGLQMRDILEGYEMFQEFDYFQLRLIEPLRSLRIMHYAAWLARRWQDPAFPLAFPWFNSQHFWQDHILSLREQMANLQEPPLQIPY